MRRIRFHFSVRPAYRANDFSPIHNERTTAKTLVGVSPARITLQFSGAILQSKFPWGTVAEDGLEIRGSVIPPRCVKRARGRADA
jgi:hypothetical protein